MIDFVIDSYDQLLDNLQNIIQKYDFKYYFNDIDDEELKLTFDIQKVQFDNKHEMAVQYLRQKQKDFLIRADIIMNVVLQRDKVKKAIPVNDFFLLLPIVTNCKYDEILYQSTKQRWDNGQDITQPGGDIIFKGVPYLVQNSLTQPFNKPIINKSDKDNQIVFANYLYQPDVMFGNSYYTTYALLQDKDNSLDIVMNFNQSQDRIVKRVQIPIFLVFRAYGIKTDEEAIQFCNPENNSALTYFLINIIRNGNLHKQYYANSKMTQEQAKKVFIDLLRNQSIKAPDEEIIVAIEKYIRPFNQAQQFAYTLGEIIKGIHHSYITQEFSNRDSLHNKRVRTIGQQIHREILQVIQRSFNQAMYSMKEMFKQYKFENIDKDEKFIKQFSEKMNYMSINCSDMLVKSFVSSADDKIAPLQKTLNEQKNIILDIMQKRQIVIRSESMGGKVSWLQRKMQYDFYGFICPITTPEGGAATGRYQSIPIYSYVSKRRDADDITEYIKHHKLYQTHYTKNSMPIKVNYNTIGFVKYKDMFSLYDDLMKYRHKYSLYDKSDHPQKYDLVYYKKDSITKRANHLFTSIYYSIENPHLGVWTDYGRIMTPIMKGTWKGSLEDMIKTGNLIYICSDMADNFIVQEFSQAKPSDWKFLPQGIIGEYPSYCPFSGNQKAVRALYSTNQMKQNIAIPYTNPMCQMTNQQLTLVQPQIAPVDTTMSRCMFEQKPSLQLVYVVFKPYTFNQEDALVSNEGYFYRNGSSTNSYKTFVSKLLENEQFKYDKRDKNKLGQNIKFQDTLISKVNTEENIDHNTTYDLAYPCKYTTISSVNDKKDDAPEILIQTQLTRYPAEGDKFISRNAQKSTIGAIVPEYKLDILESGIVPTFFFNPHSVLKRETYGQVLEPVMTQYLAKTKKFTIDYGHDMYDISLLDTLSKEPNLQGYSKYGNKLNMGIMGGPMMYSVQKHLVAQKLYAVDRAMKNKVTNQPAQGRKRHGGMRIGNLEQSAFYAQGISKVIKDEAGVNSSYSKWYFCKTCNKNQVYKLAVPKDGYEYNCPTCGLTNNVVQLGFSYQENMLQKILDSIACQMVFREGKE